VRSRPARAAALSLAIAALAAVAPGAHAAGGITLLSVAANGDRANGESRKADISARGRYVVFQSNASNLVAGDDNGRRDVFIADTRTGKLRLVSLSSRGKQGDAGSQAPSISADGRHVAFVSRATNLAGPRTEKRASQIFVRDLKTQRTTLVSSAPGGELANGVNRGPRISADGGFVAWESFARNLVAGDTNRSQDVFVHELATGTTERVSVGPAGEQGDEPSGYPSISADGRYVAFDTMATNFLPGPGALFGVYIRDRVAQTTELVSADAAGQEASGYDPSISADGRYVAFESDDLGTGVAPNIVVRDRLTATTADASVPAPGGTDENVITEHADISADGRFVAFESADDLVPQIRGCCFHVFLRDMAAMTTTWIDRGSKQVKGESDRPVVSDDGRFVAFESLSRGTEKRRYEIFLRGPIG
jgi:Tol biopolymer transport system component